MTLSELLPVVLPIVGVGAALATSAHAIMFKRDARSAVTWVGLAWLAPFVGSLLYLGFGINRIRRRALALGRAQPRRPTEDYERERRGPGDAEELTGRPHLSGLVRYVDGVVHHALLDGNSVELLEDGDAAYPAMLEAIAEAQTSVSLASYIFDRDRAGLAFVNALADAVKRGVEVRVLVDAVGARYSRPPITHLLDARDVRNARFNTTLTPWRFTYTNLRNHRKILVVDGRVGFTGGMNIREGHQRGLVPPPRDPIQDVHTRIRGPVVAQLQATFAEDWQFATAERLTGARWFPELEPAGEVLARAIPDGPDEDFETLRSTVLGALAVAEQHVRIVTPYFLPDSGLITALNVAAMRGVRVDVVLPEQGNLSLVQWASTALLWQILERGCSVWLTPPPFDHAKLMTVDDAWTLFGSSNWDPRSHRLNFEFDVECYSPDLARRVGALIDARIARGRRTTLTEVDGRSVWRRLRDGTARLLTPYL